MYLLTAVIADLVVGCLGGGRVVILGPGEQAVASTSEQPWQQVTSTGGLDEAPSGGLDAVLGSKQLQLPDDGPRGSAAPSGRRTTSGRWVQRLRARPSGIDSCY
jgi:hypothetical protein